MPNVQIFTKQNTILFLRSRPKRTMNALERRFGIGYRLKKALETTREPNEPEIEFTEEDCKMMAYDFQVFDKESIQ